MPEITKGKCRLPDALFEVFNDGAKMCILIWTNTPLKLIPAITIGHRVLPNRFALFKGHGLARENYVKKIADCLTRSNFHLSGAKHLASFEVLFTKRFLNFKL